MPPSQNQARPIAGYLLSLCAALAWSGTSPGIRYLLDIGVARMPIALWRDVFVAAALFAAFLLFRPNDLRLDRKTLIGLAVSGVFTIGVYHVAWVYSVQMNGAAVAVVLVYLYNAFVTIGGRLFFNDPIRPKQVVALILSFIGCVLVVKAYDLQVLLVSWLGVLIGLGSALLQAAYVFVNQRAIKTINPLASLAYLMLFGSVALFVFTLLFAPNELFDVPNLSAWLALMFVAIGPTLGGYGLFNSALRYVPGKIAGLISVLEVPAATLLAFFMFGEALSALQIVGMILILIAAVLPNV